MMHTYLLRRCLTPLFLLLVGLTQLFGAAPYVNDYVSEISVTQTRVFDASEDIPFLEDYLRAYQNRRYANQLQTSNCFSVLTAGNDTTGTWGDTILLIATATNTDGMGNNTNYGGFWYVDDGSSTGSPRGLFLNPDGTPASQPLGGFNFFNGSFFSDSDTILFLRDPNDPLDGAITDFTIVFQSSNPMNSNCVDSDTVMVTLDLEPNLTLNADGNGAVTSLTAGNAATDEQSTAYCTGTTLDLDALVTRNPTLSGLPVFIRTVVTDTADVLGLAALNGGVDPNGDTLYLTPSQLDITTTLINLGPQDIFVELRLAPYYESDQINSTPGTSVYDPGIDPIGDTVVLDFLIFAEPLVSFGGNDTICFAADVPLDFTGTPNTRIYYRDTITGALDSVDLDGLGRFVDTIFNVTEDLFFVVDSMRRLAAPFCEASMSTVTMIAPQPFIVLDSIGATVFAVDSVACDTSDLLSFGFFANDSSSIYSFILSNSLDDFDSTYLAQGEDTLMIDLADLNFGGLTDTVITFYLNSVVDTSSTSNCGNSGLLDSFRVFIDTVPVFELTFEGTTLTSGTDFLFLDTLCVSDGADYSATGLSTAASGFPMWLREIDSLYNLNTGSVVVFDTMYFGVAGYGGTGVSLAPTSSDSQLLVRTLRPYFEADAATSPVTFDPAAECFGDSIRLEILLTPAPLEPDVAWLADTICSNGVNSFKISNGTPGSVVGYELVTNGINSAFQTVMLDAMGMATVTVMPTATTGTIIVDLETVAATCNDFIDGSDTITIKPAPNGSITLVQDSVCRGDSVFLVFNTTTTFDSPLSVDFESYDLTNTLVQTFPTVLAANGDTIGRFLAANDLVYELAMVEYNSAVGCALTNLNRDTLRVDSMPALQIGYNEISVSPNMNGMSPATAPDTLCFEVCANDSLYLDYGLPTPGDTSRFGDSVFVALFINDPIGVTAAGAGTTTTFRDIDNMTGFDTLFLQNPMSDTVRVEILAIPFFTGVDAMGNPTTPYATACKGDSLLIKIDIINNFVSTIGGNYEVCFGTDTIAVITGPDSAIVDYEAIYENPVGSGMFDTTMVRTDTLDNQGRFEIPVDSIVSDTTYRLVSARLIGSGCAIIVGQPVTVEVVDPPTISGAMDSITVCEGESFVINLAGGPANGFGRIYDSLGIDTLNFSIDAMGNAAIPIDSILTSRKYYLDSIIYVNGALECSTDTIVDSVYVTVLPAPRLTIIGDTICAGDTAYVTLVAPMLDTFDLQIDSAGMSTITVLGAIDGDTILTIPGLMTDSLAVILLSATQTDGNMCPVFTPLANIDTAYLRVNDLPQLSINFTMPVVDTVDAMNSDTIRVCENDVITAATVAVPDTNLFGADVAYSYRLSTNGGAFGAVNTVDSTGLATAINGTSTINIATPTTYCYEIIPYVPNTTGAGGTMMPYDPTMDCAGDTVKLNILVNPIPTATYAFGQDTICENETTSVQIVGNPGDTVLFGVGSFGSTTIVIPASGTFNYTMPTVAAFDAQDAAFGFPIDDLLVFAILSVRSNTMPSCSNTTLLLDTIVVERTPDLMFSVVDTTVCVGDPAQVIFSGANAANAMVHVSLDYENLTDGTAVIPLDAMGNFTYTISPFSDTLTITVDSVVSNSSRACTVTIDSTLARILSVPLPTAEFVPDTVCSGDPFYMTFNYTGNRTLTAQDSFIITYLDPGGMTIMDTVRNGDTVVVANEVAGSYTYQLLSISDSTTMCTNTFGTGSGIPFTNVVDAAPKLVIDFSGTVLFNQTYDTDVPQVFPNPGTTVNTNVCSGASLISTVTSSNMSAMGDPTYIRVTIHNDPFAVFNGLTSPIDTTVSFLNLNDILTNSTFVNQQLSFSFTPYFETDSATGMDMDECSGPTWRFNINVRPDPVATFSNPDTMRICSGDSIQLGFTGSLGATVTFEDDDGNTYPTGTVDPSFQENYVASQAGPDTVRFFTTSVSQTFPPIGQVCFGSQLDTVVLIVNPLPRPYLEFTPNDTICFNDQVGIVFRDTVGTGPWTVTVNGTTFSSVGADGTLLFTTTGIAVDTGFTISAASDVNGCAADTILGGFVFTDTVRVEDVPLLTTDLTLRGPFGGLVGTDQLVDGLLTLDTFCALTEIRFVGNSMTPMNLAGDPLYVRIDLSGDVNDVWGSMYFGDTTLYVPFGSLAAFLNTGLIPNSSDTTLDARILLTPYFESNTSMPGTTAGQCSGAVDTIDFFVDPRPDPISNNLEFTICSGSTFSYDPINNLSNQQIGTTFTYLVTSTGTTTAPDRLVGSAAAINDVLTNFTTSVDTVTYTIRPFSASGCEGDDFVIDVIVEPAPVLVAGNDTICSGTESLLDINHLATAVNPQFYIVDTVIFDATLLTGLDVVGIGDTVDRSVTTGGTGVDNFFIRDTYENYSTDTQRVDYVLIPLVDTIGGNGCLGAATTYSLFIAPAPLVMNRDTQVCTDVRLNIDLQATVDNGTMTNFSWFAVSGDFALIDGETTTLTNTGFITDSLRLTTSALSQQRQITYLVTATGTNGCPSPPETFFYTVFVNPQIQLLTSTPEGDFICSGDPDGIPIVATATNSLGALTYNWMIDSVGPGVINPQIINPTGNGSTVNVNATGNGQFTVDLIVTDVGGCAETNTFTITVYDDLAPSFDTTYVGGTNSPTVDFTDTSDGFPTQWLWTFGDPASGSADTSMAQNPTHTFTAPGTYNVTLRVIRQAFCPDTATVTQQVFIGFTPVFQCDTVILYPGWNVISLDVDSSDNSVTAIFDEIINNMVGPGNSNLNQVVGVHPDQSATPLIFAPPFFLTLSNIRPGFGYAVNVDVQDTLIVCGTAIDPNLRVDLQVGINIVGYVPQPPSTIASYFDTLITNNDLAVLQTYTMGNFGFWIPNAATVFNVMNGQGYVLDVSSAYTGNQWRDNQFTSSNFQYIHGTTSYGAAAANLRVEVIGPDGEVYTSFYLDEEGRFGPEFLFGSVDDPNLHESLGIPNGTEVRFRIGDNVSSTSHPFVGDWWGTELDIQFEDALSSVGEESLERISYNVFPNPTSGAASLDFRSSTPVTELRIEVIDGTGRLINTQVETTLGGNTTIPLAVRNLPAGVYLLRLRADGNYIGSEQLIIRR